VNDSALLAYNQHIISTRERDTKQIPARATLEIFPRLATIIRS